MADRKGPSNSQTGTAVGCAPAEEPAVKTKIEMQDGAIQVDAAIVAEGLAIDPSLLQQRMRKGAVTSLCERGLDADKGHYRLTFFSQNRRFRLIVDEQGNVLQRAALNVGGRTRSRPSASRT